MVWQDNTPGNPDIFFSASTDGGLTFSEPENISENSGGSVEPQISSTTSQENPNSEIQMTNPTQQTISAAAFKQQQLSEDSTITLSQGLKDSPTIDQGTTEDDSTAMEKITKLKQQWLSNLP